MIFSRSLACGGRRRGLRGEGDRADLRAGLRAMTELLCTKLLAPNSWAAPHARDYGVQCRPAIGRFQGGVRGRQAVSRRAPANAWSRRQPLRVISGARPSLPISTSSAAAVVPPGEVTFSRNTAASSAERCSSSPEPATVSRASFCGKRRPAVRRRRRLAPALRQAGRHRPAPIPTPPSPRPSALRRRSIRRRRWRQSRRCASSRCAGSTSRGTATVMPRPIAAGVLGMARTSAHGVFSAPAMNCSVRPAMIETTTVEAPIIGASGGSTSAAACGFTAMTMAATSPSACSAGLSRSPRAASADDLRRRLRLEHRDVASDRGRTAASLRAARCPSCRRRPGRGRPEKSRKSGVANPARAAGSIGGRHASPDVSNMAESIASRADLPAQTTNWNAGK